MKVDEIIINMGFTAYRGNKGQFINERYDNDELHDMLNDECTHFQVLMDQDTWSFGDGSFITRNEDVYVAGNDVTELELTDELSKEQGQ